MHFRCWRPSFIPSEYLGEGLLCAHNTLSEYFFAVEPKLIQSENYLTIDNLHRQDWLHDWCVRAPNAFLTSAFTVIVEEKKGLVPHGFFQNRFSLFGDRFNCSQRNKWSVSSVIGSKKGVMPTFLLLLLFWPFVLTWHPITPCHRTHLYPANKVREGSNYHSALWSA